MAHRRKDIKEEGLKEVVKVNEQDILMLKHIAGEINNINNELQQLNAALQQKQQELANIQTVMIKRSGANEEYSKMLNKIALDIANKYCVDSRYKLDIEKNEFILKDEFKNGNNENNEKVVKDENK